jgi:hypothetical protein
MEQKLRAAIREIIKKELEENSTTAACPGYQTPGAFKQTPGMEDETRLTVRKKLNLKPVNEEDEVLEEARSRYELYKEDESASPKQKIGRAIKEIDTKLNEINHILELNHRLKLETNTGSGDLWKRTHKHLTRLESKLHRSLQRIRELKA